MRLAICSYSFHRLLAAGRQDIHRYITDCKSLGCTQLDPWMKHLAPIDAGCDALRALPDPHLRDAFLTSDELRYLAEVRRSAERANIPFGCLAVDGGHMFESRSAAPGNPAFQAAQNANRAVAYRWIDVAAVLGCPQIRLDAGGTEAMPPDEFEHIVAGFKDVIARAAPRGVEVLFENHWGATSLPGNCLRILAAVPGLGMLWDSYNFHPHHRRTGRELCAPHARNTHLKTFRFDAAGNEPDEDIPHALAALRAARYHGTLGVESCPPDLDELEAASKTISLIREHA